MIPANLNILKDMNLLLIDDDDELNDNLKELFSFFFLNVYSSKNGEEAFEIYQNNNIDVIITDYIMPKMDGCEFCKKIREINDKIPIVMISAYIESEKLLKVIPLKLIDYLVKPFEFNLMIVTLTKIAEELNKDKLINIKLCEAKNYNLLTKVITDVNSNSTVKLTKSEIIIIELLLENINKIVPIETIQEKLSLTDIKSEQAVRSQLYRLRMKTCKNLIKNIQNIGYIIEKEV